MKRDPYGLTEGRDKRQSRRILREAGRRRARRRTCEPHGGAFKAQHESPVFRCGSGCEEVRPEWPAEHGWALRA